MTSVTGILLAGGKSSRMGRPKALLPFKGEPLIHYPLKLLKELCSEVFIVTNSPELYMKFPAKILTDIYPNRGPMGGIYTGLKEAKNEWSAVLGCDMPLVRNELLEALFAHIDPSKEVILPYSKERNGKIFKQTLCTLYSKKCLSLFEKRIESGESSLHKTLGELKVQLLNGLDLDPKDLQGTSFTNLNNPADYAAIS